MNVEFSTQQWVKGLFSIVDEMRSLPASELRSQFTWVSTKCTGCHMFTDMCAMYTQ